MQQKKLTPQAIRFINFCLYHVYEKTYFDSTHTFYTFIIHFYFNSPYMYELQTLASRVLATYESDEFEHGFTLFSILNETFMGNPSIPKVYLASRTAYTDDREHIKQIEKRMKYEALPLESDIKKVHENKIKEVLEVLFFDAVISLKSYYTEDEIRFINYYLSLCQKFPYSEVSHRFEQLTDPIMDNFIFAVARRYGFSAQLRTYFKGDTSCTLELRQPILCTKTGIKPLSVINQTDLPYTNVICNPGSYTSEQEEQVYTSILNEDDQRFIQSNTTTEAHLSYLFNRGNEKYSHIAKLLHNIESESELKLLGKFAYELHNAQNTFEYYSVFEKIYETPGLNGKIAELCYRCRLGAFGDYMKMFNTNITDNWGEIQERLDMILEIAFYYFGPSLRFENYTFDELLKNEVGEVSEKIQMK